VPIPDDRCQRCTGVLDPADTWDAWGDRVCGHCAGTARKRGEQVTRIEPPAPAA
jgi:hypothetical protein